MHPSIVEAFHNHCRREYPLEAVGVVRDGAFVTVPNFADDPELDFAIRPHELIRATHLLHSHSRSQLDYPTPADVVLSNAYPDIIFGLSTTDGKNCSRVWTWGRRAPIADYIGRRFHFFFADCARLVVDWYRCEMGLPLPDFPRTPRWWDQGEDLWRDGLRASGFVEVPTPQVGDTMLIRLGRAATPIHGGVIVGPDDWLHHPQGHEYSDTRLSRIDSLSSWRRHAHSYWRPPS